MAIVDYSTASATLSDIFERTAQPTQGALDLLETYGADFDTVFASNTQSYREVLLGCSLIHLLHPEVDIRLPYVKQGDRAFNGRTLDEKVINPFLYSKQIPCSKGPYLATFRRNVKLDASSREGLRDKVGYDAMLAILDVIETAEGESSRDVVTALLLKFIELREASDIQLVSVARLSIEQYSMFLAKLLRNQSGGLIPMLLTEAIFQTINQQHSCGWEIYRQGINAADGATGMPGDVTISRNGQVYKAIEVTERPIAQSRVVTTFNTKISVGDVRDYLFIYTDTRPDDGAYESARTFFAQGYDINFAKITDIILSTFTVGSESTRVCFMDIMLSLLRGADVPAAVKTAWNDALQATISA